MKKTTQFLIALIAVALVSSYSYAQPGHHGRGDGSPDTTFLHHLDSLLHHGHDGGGNDTLHGGGGMDTLKGHDGDHDSTGDHGGKDTTINGGGKDSTGNHGGRGGKLGNHGRRPGPHGRIDIWRLLSSDSCRLALEAQMADSDVTTLNAALDGLKADAAQLDTLRGQIRAARMNNDTATAHALLTQYVTILQDERTLAMSIGTVLSRYPDAINAVWKDCTQHKVANGGGNGGGSSDLKLAVMPIFPNPVSVSRGMGNVTLTYMLSADADVNIALSDAQGNLLQQIAMDHEVAGQHTQQIPVSGLQDGVYIVRVQAGTVVQSQKLVVIK